ncbi:iron chelate uptake ABC transporter family permease subunit, partial [Zhenhengia sp.]|uniref:iron chelate uptake ABC transporter family permease subunit n=1 Tax=Zhenhengia sp. TaxID=2944208 RepID=UPI00307A4F00
MSVLIVLLILSIVIAVAIGSTYIAPREVYKAIIYKLTNGLMYKDTSDAMVMAIIWEIRLPRVLLGALCGAGLALCGILMQCVTKNPIAEPYVLGLSSGASCGAVAVIVLGSMSSVGITSITIGAF